ncbi:MAG TPA: hypothetical protein VFI91_04645 [Longimicrobiaceae bacterium]|nr:hypothetical protein [Longimicrobiaceae bacterium]
MQTHGEPIGTGERLLGWLGAGLVVLAIVVFFVGGESDGAAAIGPPPAVEVIAPADGEALEGPLVFVFTAPGNLAPMPGGWGVAPFHLHAEIDGVEYMPAPDDIAREDGRYRWHMGPLPAGRHELRLFWADAQHRPVRDGSTAMITVGVR